MINKIYSFICENDMLAKDDKVICGLSGGADSTCLLLALYELRERLDISLEALHVNHCLRGSESDRDEAFCRNLCEKLNIPFTVVSCNVKDYSESNSLSVEEAARKLRYSAFEKNSAGKKIATAHNANDNLETMLLNIARGTALKGLAGIPPIRENIIRPLLAVTRNEIEEYLLKHGQSFVTDSTNLSDDYTRNKIRHKIIPLMQEINVSVIETTIRSIGVLRAENDFIEAEVENALKKCRNGNKLVNIGLFSRVVAERCIIRILSENALPYSYDKVSEAYKILGTGGKFNVSGDFYFISDCGSIELKQIPPPPKIEFYSETLKIGNNSIYPGIIFKCEIIQCDNLKKIKDVHKKSTYYLLDYDKIKGRTVLRSRRFGDKIQLTGRSFFSSVKKLINETVPPSMRSSIHFIEDEEGTIFAEHIGIAERVTPDENTCRFLKITVGKK